MFKNELKGIIDEKECLEKKDWDDKRKKSIQEAKLIVEEIKNYVTECVKNGNFKKKGNKRLVTVEYRTYMGRYLFDVKSGFLKNTFTYRVESEVYDYIKSALSADGFMDVKCGFYQQRIKLKPLLELKTECSESNVQFYVDCCIEF